MDNKNSPYITVINPGNGKVIDKIKISSRKEVNLAVEKAQETFKIWSSFPIKKRISFILNVKRYILDHMDEIVEILHNETGKIQMEVLTHELLGPIDTIYQYAKKAPQLLKPKKFFLHLVPYKKSEIHYKPKGVIGIISPWNFPFTIPMGEIIMALLAGNTVVLKPSEITPLSGLLIEKIFQKAGLPNGVVQTIIGYGKTGADLMDSDIDHIVFTGSVPTGKIIAQKAAEKMISSTLELGGKDPMIVLPDADIKRTARGALFGAFANSGQVCASVERVYVHRSIYDEFLDEVVHQTLQLRQGKDRKPGDYDIGPIISEKQLDTIQKHIDDAKKKKAKILTGGKLKENTVGRFFEPTIIANANHKMLCMTEETFGPTMPIMPYDTIDEVVMLANSTIYGLTASVWGKNKKLAMKTARRIEAGTVIINDAIYTHAAAETPWSGVKNSGMGIVHSDMGLLEFTNLIHINKPALINIDLWWYPYTEKSFKFFKNFVFLFSGNFYQRIKGLIGFISLNRISFGKKKDQKQ